MVKYDATGYGMITSITVVSLFGIAKFERTMMRQVFVSFDFHHFVELKINISFVEMTVDGNERWVIFVRGHSKSGSANIPVQMYCIIGYF